MKKSIYLFLCGVLICCVLSGCKKSTGNDKQNGPSVNLSIGNGQNKNVQNSDSKSEEPQTSKDVDTTKEPLQSTNSNTDSSKGSLIEDQSFDVTLDPIGKVKFASYEPNTSKEPLTDAVFCIEQEGSTLQELPGVFDDNIRANEMFCQVEAVSFTDYNHDGNDDIIIICSYEPSSGPEVGTGYSEVRLYSGSDQGTFALEDKIAQDINTTLEQFTIKKVKEYLHESFLEPWKKAYIDYLNHDSVVDEQDGYVLISIDDDNIPELVEIGNCEAIGCRIVNYSKGEAHVSQLCRLYFSYIEKGNLLCNSEGHMDCYFDDVYSIIDGEMQIVASGCYGAEDNSNVQYDESGEPIYKYSWEGTEMSMEDYQQKLDAVYDSSKAKRGYDYEQWYTIDEIIQLINEWK